MTRTTKKRITGLLGLIVLAASLLASPASVDAQSNPYQRGPDPTASALEQNGPYSTTTSSVSSSVSGFGGGTIYYPSSTSETFGGIAVSPGYTASSSSMAWYGRRLASHGFVVIVIDTNSRYDYPDSRATQLLAAVDYLRNSAPSAVRARLDGTRMAVAGHSMGGGGSLSASNQRPSLRASNPLTPWHTTKTWSGVTVPQLIIGAEDDTIASTGSHAVPFYNGLPSSTYKAYVELNGASHMAPNSDNATISRLAVAWMKRFVDEDSRYSQFLCGPGGPSTADPAISRYMSNCPYGSTPSSTTTTAPSTSTTTTAPPSTTTTTVPTSTCVRSSNATHVNQGRAVSYWGYAYARGSGDYLGRDSYYSYSSLRETGPDYWVEVSSC